MKSTLTLLAVLIFTNFYTQENNTKKVVPFAVVEKPFIFPGCESESIQQTKACTNEKISKFINENYNVKIASDLGLEGGIRIYTNFKVDTEGNVFDIKVSAPDPKLGEECERVINLLPKFTPSSHNGEMVITPYSLPISFQVKPKPNPNSIVASKETFHKNQSGKDDVEIVTEKYSNGKLKSETTISKGKKNGLQKEWHPNGKLSFEGNYKDDKKIGKWLYYYENGQIEKEQEFVEGESNGKWVWYYENGKLWADKEYKNGKEIDYHIYSKDGDLIEEKYGNIDFFNKKEKVKKYSSDGSRCITCKQGIYVNGSCDLCGSVSRERLKETTDKLPKCSLCNGTGYEKSRNTNESRICPMCQGKGYRTY